MQIQQSEDSKPICFPSFMPGTMILIPDNSFAIVTEYHSSPIMLDEHLEDSLRTLYYVSLNRFCVYEFEECKNRVVDGHWKIVHHVDE